MNLVIVAGGLGSRLAPITNNIPKFLVNIGKETGLVEMIRYWKQYQLESITVIVNSVYKDLTQAYFDLYFAGDQDLVMLNGDDEFVPIPFIIKTVDVANGSAHAIITSCDHLIDSQVMFTWCDVLPGESFDLDTLQQMGAGAIAFTNYDHPNRYDLVKVGDRGYQRVPQIREDGRGGLFGVYYVSQYKRKYYVDGTDFVEILGAYSYVEGGYVAEFKMPSIIDFGDMPKLERTRATDDGARSFNSVEMHGDLVLKTALNEQGKNLISREIRWYETLETHHSTVRRPNFWPHRNHESFVMSKVKGLPIYQVWPTLDDEGRRMVLSRIFEQLDMLHSTQKPTDISRILADVTAEAYTKLITRYEEIKPVIDAFGPVQLVNHTSLHHTPKELIEWLHSELCTEYAHEKSYSLIHGDLQMSNSMIDPDTLEVTFIDPRGYFGKTDTYGLADYDLAKLLYSLSGYDLFNYSTNFSISHLGPLGSDYSLGDRFALQYTMPKPNLSGVQELIESRFKRKHYLWLAVHWIGLAQYIKNDPVKSLCAHYRGLAKAEQLMTGRVFL